MAGVAGMLTAAWLFGACASDDQPAEPHVGGSDATGGADAEGPCQRERSALA